MASVPKFSTRELSRTKIPGVVWEGKLDITNSLSRLSTGRVQDCSGISMRRLVQDCITQRHATAEAADAEQVACCYLL